MITNFYPEKKLTFINVYTYVFTLSFRVIFINEVINLLALLSGALVSITSIYFFETKDILIISH